MYTKPNFGPEFERTKEMSYEMERIDAFLAEGAMANEYQDLAAKTAIFPGEGGPLGITYCALKLNGEAGEVAELIGKAIRDDGYGTETDGFTVDRRAKLVKELGDVQWYIAVLAQQAGFSLSFLMGENLRKLAKRQMEGTLQGSGSDR